MNSNLFTPTKTSKNSDIYSFQVKKDLIQDLRTAKDSRSPSLEETECNNNLISRKTLRGRKEKIPLPKNELKCEICLEFLHFSKEDLISCSTCKCLFHKSCYSQYELYENSSYKCIRCLYALKLGKSINDYKCFICGNSNGVLNMNNITECFYHKICLNLLNEFKDLEGEELCKEKIRKWRYKNSCRYCGEKLSKSKAVIKCKNPKCKEYYHIPCAIEKGMIFDLKYMKQFYNVLDNDDIPFYCSNHNKKISFMYKTYVENNINKFIFKSNLFKNEFTLCERKEIEKEKTFLDFFDEKNFIGQNSLFFENDDEKLQNKEFSLIEKNNEENNNDNKKKDDLSLQKEKLSEKVNKTNMDIDDSSENNYNVFNLDFGKFIKENENVFQKSDNIFYQDICNENQFHNYLCNSELTDYSNDNCFLLNKQKSFDSLPFTG